MSNEWLQEHGNTAPNFFHRNPYANRAGKCTLLKENAEYIDVLRLVEHRCGISPASTVHELGFAPLCNEVRNQHLLDGN